MTTRTQPHNASEHRTLIKYRIDIKNQSGKWQPLRIRGAMQLFDNPYHANNYGLKMNPNHKIFTP